VGIDGTGYPGGNGYVGRPDVVVGLVFVSPPPLDVGIGGLGSVTRVVGTETYGGRVGATYVGVVVVLVLDRPSPDEVGIAVGVEAHETAGETVRVEIWVNVVTYDTVETCKEVTT